ncbi:hypothetical protein NZK35_15790 [Stieleria sp. ICT_E10.1]|uniref:hypothetical protein n=1 Tax=Stieleria sedimenti TaxID=2976331 RepID=UPI00217F9AD3|nr:hypothetical protein [Stieleria sedimenti]MCS7468113.1 hypothetical protein [Stieleria sedimenti]
MSRFLAVTLFLMIATCFSVTTEASAAEVVHFQCKEWKAKHIHDAKKATAIAGTLKKLGCEVKEEQHNGHLDVKYRCVKERTLPVKSHAEAVKWEKWFKEYGFKVYHTH